MKERREEEKSKNKHNKHNKYFILFFIILKLQKRRKVKEESPIFGFKTLKIMLACGGSRISQQNLGLGLCSTRIALLSSFMVKPPSSAAAIVDYNYNHRFQPRFVSSSTLQSKSHGDIPILPDSFSQREDEREHPSETLSSVAGGIVALGKFDALHIGHRELAIQASKVGTPYLLSFVGMAEVLGWEPRLPIVAQCDRKRVLSSWASYCGNVAPKEFQIQFMSVRHLTPQQFVEKLVKELGVCGVVADCFNGLLSQVKTIDLAIRLLVMLQNW
ncbi:hypothetical protein CRYUN_Cryun10bG0084600 [Craigia yunnanensis]